MVLLHTYLTVGVIEVRDGCALISINGTVEATVVVQDISNWSNKGLISLQLLHHQYCSVHIITNKVVL